MAQLIVITTPELASGFRLAGVETYAADTSGEAHRRLLALLDDQEAGILAIDQTYLDSFDTATRRQLERRYRPVTIGIPAGQPGGTGSARHLELAELIRRAIGVRIAFRGAET